jgi:hypothetical protein
VWPLGYHGPNVPSNRTQVCANAHSDVHYLLDLLLKTDNNVPWNVKRTFGYGVRLIAYKGYYQVMAYMESLVPTP